MEAVFERLASVALRVFDAAATSVALFDDDREHLRYVAAAGSTSDDVVGLLLPSGRGIAGWVAQTGEPIEVRDPSGDPRFARDVAERLGYVPAAIATAPVRHGGEVLGVVQVLDARSGDLDLLAELADLAGVVVAATSGTPSTAMPGDVAAAVHRLGEAAPVDRATGVRLLHVFLDHVGAP